jgi:replicative DNA helicase
MVQDIVSQADFYVEAHRAIFDAMIEVSGRGITVDAISLADTLKARGVYDRVGGAAYLDQLIDRVPIAAYVEQHAEMIRDKAIVRRLILACSQVISDSFGDLGDVPAFLDRCEQTIFEVSRSGGRSHTLPLGRAVKEVFGELDALSKSTREVTGVPTGYAKLDSLTSGLQPGDLVIIAGRPSVGKTSFCLNLVMNASGQGEVPVGFFSLEMSYRQLVRRILAAEAGVSGHKLRTPYKLDQDEWVRLFVAADRLQKLRMFLDDSPMLTVAQLRGKARRLKIENDIGLVAIDYLQLMRPVHSRDSREREIAEISRSLKALALELQIPVVALSQLSREVEKRQDKRPVLADLRESGAIEQDADMVMFLHDKNPTDVDRSHKDVDLILAKHRSGPTGTVPLVFRGDLTRFDAAAFDAPDDADVGFGGAGGDDGAF